MRNIIGKSNKITNWQSCPFAWSDAQNHTPLSQAWLQLRRVRRLQALGLSLQEIKRIFQADDPDITLQIMLERRRAELVRQQERIDEHLQRIDDCLAEGAWLRVAEQPDPPSTTFQVVEQALGELAATLPPEVAAFDRTVLGKLDSFRWESNDHQLVWKEAASYFVAHPDQYRALAPLVEKFVALSHLSEDAPEIEHWAEEIARSPAGVAIRRLRLYHLDSTDTDAALKTEVIACASHEQLTGAQQRFFQILNELLNEEKG
jgi:DNA-binding transcriptional MerR regulator